MTAGRERRRGAGAVALACVALAWLGAGAAVASAHTGGSTGYASITVSGNAVRYSLTLSPTALPPAVADELRLVRSGRPDAGDRLLRLLRDTLALDADGTACAAGPGAIMPPTPESLNVTLVVDFACAAQVRVLVIRDNVFEVIGTDHHTLAKVESGGLTWQFAFEPSAREARVVIEGGARTAGGGAGGFLLLGVQHILSGYDHLLFLLALLLGGGGFVAMLKIVTAFTLAHSVTLALAVLDVVVMPDRLVEAAIALSIAVVAAENLVRRRAVPARWVASFVFGLVHGFGFSSALRELGLPREGLALALLGFNLGVEAGQALVVAVALPLLLRLRRTRWEWRVVAASSAAILLIGLILFVERAAGW